MMKHVSGVMKFYTDLFEKNLKKDIRVSFMTEINVKNYFCKKYIKAKKKTF